MLFRSQACVAARAETSRLASFATSAEIVSWFNMTWRQPTLRPQHGVESGQAGAKRPAGNGVRLIHEPGYTGAAPDAYQNLRQLSGDEAIPAPFTNWPGQALKQSK